MKKRTYLHIAVVMALAPAGLNNVLRATAAQGATEFATVMPAVEDYTDGLYYYSDGRPIPLTVSAEKIGICFDDELDWSEREAIIEADIDLEELDDRAFPTGLRIVTLRPGLSSDAVLAKVSEVGKLAGVKYATPVFTTDSPTEMLLTDQFIVSFNPEVTREQVDALNEASGVQVVRVRQSARDGASRYVLRFLNPKGMTASEMLDTVNSYYESPLTGYAVPNFQRTQLLHLTIPNDTYFGNQWNLHNTGQNPPGGTVDADIDTPEAWDTETGTSSLVIAIIDTGVDLDHEDLDAKIWSNSVEVNGTQGVDDDGNGYTDDFYGWDFVDPEDGTPDDGYGHGTCCAGIASAETNNNQGVAGVAWDGKIMVLRIFNNNGQAVSDSDIGDAINYAWENGADILSNSWGGGWPSDPITWAIQDAKNDGRDGKGCVVVFSSGNSRNPNGVMYPAELEEVIAVGASNEDDERCTEDDWPCDMKSCYGPELDVVAPGNDLYTTDIEGADNGYNNREGPDDPNNCPGYDYCDGSCPDGAGDYYDDFGGTSGACPHVAGLANLVLSRNTNFTAAQVQAIIQFSADDEVGDALEDDEGRDHYMGYGRINADRALDLADASRFVINDNNGNHLASFDSDGNFVLEPHFVYNEEEEEWESIGGLLYEDQGSISAVANESEFIIKNVSSEIVALIDEESNMWIKGSLTENQSSPDPGEPRAFIIKDNNGNIVAYIDENGDFVLKGRAFIGGDPDRGSSQGE